MPKKLSKVKDVIKIYEKNNVQGVYEYLTSDKIYVDPSTWCGNIKKAIDNGHVVSVMAEIELIKEKFNFYKNVSKENSNSGARTTHG